MLFPLFAILYSEERYRALLKNVETAQVFKKSAVKVWECRNCGHLVVGTNAPNICPACAHPQSYFEINAENYNLSKNTVHDARKLHRYRLQLAGSNVNREYRNKIIDLLPAKK